jgi:hypothetical protein
LDLLLLLQRCHLCHQHLLLRHQLLGRRAIAALDGCHELRRQRLALNHQLLLQLLCPAARRRG